MNPCAMPDTDEDISEMSGKTFLQSRKYKSWDLPRDPPIPNTVMCMCWCAPLDAKVMHAVCFMI